MREGYKNKAITLISLIITIIIMLILAGVVISMITTDKIPFGKVKEVENQYQVAAKEEKSELSQLLLLLLGEYEDPSGANKPILATGMAAITFQTDGTTELAKDLQSWYNYEEKQWANAESLDGSLWVWIPRFAYKITYITTEDKTQGGTIEVVFLKDTSNNYEKNVEGKKQLRDASEDGYIIHPSFQAAKNNNYDNGEWEKELKGYWVAKFEAGFQQGDAIRTQQNDITKVTRSSISYTSPLVELEKKGFMGFDVARNYIDGIYSRNTSGDLTDIKAYEMLREVKITYPVFKGSTYSMNYICLQDTYNLCRALTEQGNIYGFSEEELDTHLMKNSEWGAIIYLSYSQYGTNGKEPYINNLNLQDGARHIYTVTGYTAKQEDVPAVNSLEEAYIWYTQEGQKGSSNDNITGVYDINGGAWERTAALINNHSDSLQNFGKVLLEDIQEADGSFKSNQYITLYACELPENEVHAEATRQNFRINQNRYGDAIAETSTDGYSTVKSWNGEYSLFTAGDYPFFSRGGYAGSKSKSGIFAYTRGRGRGFDYDGFRAVIVNIK